MSKLYWMLIPIIPTQFVPVARVRAHLKDAVGPKVI